MSVDTVNFALTRVTRRIREHRESFSNPALLLGACACMRDYLMNEQAEELENYIDSFLARHPDAANYLLEDLFEELGIAQGWREDFTAILFAS